MVILREKKEPDLYQALIFYSHLRVTAFTPPPVNRQGYIAGRLAAFVIDSSMRCGTFFYSLQE